MNLIGKDREIFFVLNRKLCYNRKYLKIIDIRGMYHG